jgi:hypothetical protein
MNYLTRKPTAISAAIRTQWIPPPWSFATKRQPETEDDLQGEYIPKQLREKFDPNP